MGGTGDSPVLSGHWPDGTRGTLELETNPQNNSCAFPVPSGGSPVPPSPAEKCVRRPLLHRPIRRQPESAADGAVGLVRARPLPVNGPKHFAAARVDALHLGACRVFKLPVLRVRKADSRKGGTDSTPSLNLRRDGRGWNRALPGQRVLRRKTRGSEVLKNPENSPCTGWLLRPKVQRLKKA